MLLEMLAPLDGSSPISAVVDIVVPVGKLESLIPLPLGSLLVPVMDTMVPPLLGLLASLVVLMPVFALNVASLSTRGLPPAEPAAPVVVGAALLDRIEL